MSEPANKQHQQSDGVRTPTEGAPGEADIQPLSRNTVQRTIRAPHALTPADVMVLQRTAGNQAVAQLLGRGTTGNSSHFAIQPADPQVVHRSLPATGKHAHNRSNSVGYVQLKPSPAPDAGKHAHNGSNSVGYVQREPSPAHPTPTVQHKADRHGRGCGCSGCTLQRQVSKTKVESPKEANVSQSALATKRRSSHGSGCGCGKCSGIQRKTPASALGGRYTTRVGYAETLEGSPSTSPGERMPLGLEPSSGAQPLQREPEVQAMPGQTPVVQRGFWSTISSGAQTFMGGLGATIGGIVGGVVSLFTGTARAAGLKSSPGFISTIQGGARLGSRITTAPWRKKGNLGEANKEAGKYNVKIIDPKDEDRTDGSGEASPWQQKELDGILGALKVYETMLSTDSRYKTPQAIEWARRGIVNTEEYTFGKVRSQLHDQHGKYQGSGMTNAYTDTTKNHITVCGDNLLRSFGSGSYDVELEKGIAVHELCHMLLSHEVERFHTMVDTYYSSKPSKPGEKPTVKGNMWDLSKARDQGEEGGYTLRDKKGSGYEKAVTKYGGSNPEDDLCETARYYFQSEALKARLAQIAPGRYWAFEQIVAHNMSIASDEWLQKHQEKTEEARRELMEPVNTSKGGEGVRVGTKVGLDVDGGGSSSGKPPKPPRKDKKPSKPPRKDKGKPSEPPGEGDFAMERYGHLTELVGQLVQIKSDITKLIAQDDKLQEENRQKPGKAGKMMGGMGLGDQRRENEDKIKKIDKLIADIERKAKLDLKALRDVLRTMDQIPTSGKDFGKNAWGSEERMKKAGTTLMGPGTDLMGSH